MQILVVDDHDEDLQAVCAFLRDLRVQGVQAFPSAEAAAEFLERSPRKRDSGQIAMAVVAADAGRRWDGLRALVASESLEGRPIVAAITADDRRAITEALEAGATDYIVKPYRAIDVQARIISRLKTQRELVIHQAVENSLQSRVDELERHLEDATGLSAWVTVCSACRHVRDGDGWSSFERYFERRTHAQFSHGICPDCYERLRRDGGQTCEDASAAS